MQDFLKSGESNERRCDSPESLKARSCREDNVINPGKHPLIHVKNSDLSNDIENVVQLKPQNINITLRVGKLHTAAYCNLLEHKLEAICRVFTL